MTYPVKVHTHTNSNKHPHKHKHPNTPSHKPRQHPPSHTLNVYFCNFFPGEIKSHHQVEGTAEMEKVTKMVTMLTLLVLVQGQRDEKTFWNNNDCGWDFLNVFFIFLFFFDNQKCKKHLITQSCDVLVEKESFILNSLNTRTMVITS